MRSLHRVSSAEIHLPHVWQAEALACPDEVLIPSGYPLLDQHLPGGGWPVGNLIEVLQARPEQHAWRLVLPALAQAAREQPGPVVLVGAPLQPFSPSLQAQGLPGKRLLCVQADKSATRLWAVEQALRCADVVALLAWLPQARNDALRRLHLAAQQHSKLLFVFRGLEAWQESSPARLRLVLEGVETLQVRILKRRGPNLLQPVSLAPHPDRLAALLATRRGGRAATPPSLAPITSSTSAVLTLVAPKAPHALDRAVSVG